MRKPGLSAISTAVLYGWAFYWPLGWSCSWPTWWVGLGVVYFLGSSLLFGREFLRDEPSEPCWPSVGLSGRLLRTAISGISSAAPRGE